MVPFILYAATGLVTAVHLYALLSLTVVGAPHNALEFLSLAGSLGLCISGYIALSHTQLGAKLALPSALISWSFYGPAIVATVAAGPQRQIIDPRIAALPYVAVTLLVLATLYAASVSLRPTKDAAAGNWAFPARAARRSRIIAIGGSLVAVVALATWFSYGRTDSIHRPSRYLIPAGYVGWVKVEFEVPGVPELPIEGGHYSLEIPASGRLQTSSPEQFGASVDEYYYVAGRDLQPLSSTSSPGRMIWGRMNGEAGAQPNPRKYEEFFVGTEQQFRQQASEVKIGSSSSAAVAK